MNGITNSFTLRNTNNVNRTAFQNNFNNPEAIAPTNKNRLSKSISSSRHEYGDSLSIYTDGIKPGPNRQQSIAVRKTTLGKKNLDLLKPGSALDDVHKSKGSFELSSLGKGLSHFFISKEKHESNAKTRRLKGKDRLAKTISKQGFNLRKTNFEEMLSNDVSDGLLKCLYLTCVYTNNNYIGTPSPQSEDPKQLMPFIDFLIPLPSKVKQELFEKAKTIKGPPLILVLKVIEAINLKAKDANAFSDPYCKIWMNDQIHDATFTNCKYKTVDPVWNETFHFPLTDIRKDVLRIEIWDKDPTGIMDNLKMIRNVRSCRDCWLCCADFCENVCSFRGDIDDFLGKASVEAVSIYSEGTDELLSLRDEQGSEEQGELHIAAKIEVEKPKDTLDALKRHFLLVKVCVENGVKNYERTGFKVNNWKQILRRPAQTLVFQHSIQGAVSFVDDLICKLVIIIHSNQKYDLYSYEFLYAQLKETHENMPEMVYFAAHPLEEVLNAAVQNLKNSCFIRLNSFHSFCLTGNQKEASQELENVLKTVHLCEEIQGLTTSEELWTILNREGESWFKLQAKELNNIESEHETQIVLDFIKNLKEFHKAADLVMQSVFINKTYTEIVYRIMDDILSDPLKKQINKIAMASESSLGNANPKDDALSVFIELKSFMSYLEELSIPIRNLNLGDYYKWFKLKTIRDWFEWKQKAIAKQIEILVSTDDLINQLIDFANRTEKQSDSPKECAELIEKELKGLWNVVSDPQYPQCDEYFLSSFKYCISVYVNEIVSLIESRNLTEREWEGIRTICVIANNLWSLAAYVAQLMADSDALESGLLDMKVGLQLDCFAICMGISREYEPELNELIKRVAQSKTVKKQNASLRNYRTFLYETFQVRALTDMCFEVHLLFMYQMWKVMVKIVSIKQDVTLRRNTCLHKIRKCLKIAAEPIEGLLEVLIETEKILYFDEGGKLKEIFFDSDYANLKRFLQQKLEFG